ncbi:hypothetical protein ASPZODRAFT_136123 [Penicilliopsis zonata CBS 506.65]|uniref:AMP-dependent synthetase/ligase domain-containing protein n=1 Tax=Penicilliopsis zonata CBS 506.65 TaxID=1073090 RepID=A0A1L9S969_9EURO|nr:hypothetical protein ASPZODRAFT_136123 [Penicilliopsis zonata CBS 506.65]OJJ43669.1 hypothetical protein ASPZODRAFT_136123 [Penicilliopsis zonata CBS 506.65]
MSYQSIYPPIDIPHVNILSYLYPPNQTVSDKPIWIDASNPAQSLSPRQLLSWVRRLGFGLDRLGVRAGEVVLVFTPNHIFVPVAYQGIVGSGRIFSGANPAYTQSELVHQLRDTHAAVLLVHPSLLPTALAACRAVGWCPAADRVFQFADHECETSAEGVRDWRDLIGNEEQGASWKWDGMSGSGSGSDDSASKASSTVATINYSSGTTGLPKGVCVSHRNLVATVEQTIFMDDRETAYEVVPASRPEQRWIGFLPLYHAYGQLYACLMAPKLNFPIYIMTKFVFEDFLAVIQQHRITHLQVAPPILIMLDKRSETAHYDLSSLQNIRCGGAPLSKELQNTIQTRFHANVVQGWGMTEVTCGAMHVPSGRYDDSGSVGLLDPNCECKLVDDKGQLVTEPGSPGELYVRAPNVCLGYWKNETATKETLDTDGWLKTGDVMLVRENWFWIVDRKKELIKVNALQVAPAELEAVLLEHAAVADAGVVGCVPSALTGEEWPRAYIRLKDEAVGMVSARQIQQFIADRVARHKQLVGGVKFVDEVPRLASGKIRRAILREWAKRDSLPKI